MTKSSKKKNDSLEHWLSFVAQKSDILCLKQLCWLCFPFCKQLVLNFPGPNLQSNSMVVFAPFYPAVYSKGKKTQSCREASLRNVKQLDAEPFYPGLLNLRYISVTLNGPVLCTQRLLTSYQGFHFFFSVFQDFFSVNFSHHASRINVWRCWYRPHAASTVHSLCIKSISFLSLFRLKILGAKETFYHSMFVECLA